MSDPRWARVRARDAAADGWFVYAVRTTGVYCRPSCGARAPRPENVVFHANSAAAERAGFRACKRCKPNEPPALERDAAKVADLCRMLERPDGVPTLAELARAVGLSPFHTHRLFKTLTGLTPRAYARGRRASRVRSALARKTTITTALYAAGYGSAGRFYASAPQVLGMKPGVFRRGGKSSVIRFAVAACSLGSVLVAATDAGVCAVSLGDEPEALVHELERRFPRAELVGGDRRFERLVAEVVGMVENPSRPVALPLDVRGTVFQERVWQALSRIPPGKTTTYTELARLLGTPKAVRAVARACGANLLAVAVPCHRVVRKDGALAGYRWGVERKRALLAREQSQSPRPAHESRRKAK